MITDEQRKIEILNRVNDPNYKRENKKRQEQIQASLLESEERETRELLAKMDMACNEDHQIIAALAQGKLNQGSAMSRFRLLPQLT